MKSSLDEMIQRGHNFAIVDEVDSILIDEARTPLIISGPARTAAICIRSVDPLIPELTEEHFKLDEKTRNVTYTDEGNEFIEQRLRAAGLLPEGQSLYDPESTTLVHHVTQALRAHKLFHKDQHYIVRDDEVMLIDEFTGRMMRGRRLSDGLHQAIEAKEGVQGPARERDAGQRDLPELLPALRQAGRHDRHGGDRSRRIHGNLRAGRGRGSDQPPGRRVDEHDEVYRTAREKYEGIVKAIKEAHAKGQPILVGTTSIEKSELLSEMLKKEGVPHNVLNARQHEQEAQIVADAGKLGAVTIATNMAGRGTDIQLGGNVEMKVMEAIADDPAVHPDEVRARIEARACRRKGRGHRRRAGCSCWAPNATKAAGSTTSCAAGRAVRATRGGRRSSCRWKTT